MHSRQCEAKKIFVISISVRVLARMVVVVVGFCDALYTDIIVLRLVDLVSRGYSHFRIGLLGADLVATYGV
jgi:hypothetical protein